jgi:hypothetical protein
VTEVTATDTDDDDDLPVLIRHSRDQVIIDGELHQDYNFLVYTFDGDSGEVTARTYLDNIWEVSILSPMFGEAVDAAVLRYLQRRFGLIKQLGGPEGYTVLWGVERW